MTGADNAGAAAEAGDIVVVAVPWDGHGDLLRDLAPVLAGKIVVDCVNPLGFDKQGAYALQVEEGSAAQQAAALLPDSTVVGAFHNVSAVKLEDPEVTSVDTDVLVLGEGEDREACDRVQDLAGTIPGVRGVYAGRLRNAHQVEALDREPDQRQPPLQGARRHPDHRHLRRTACTPHSRPPAEGARAARVAAVVHAGPTCSLRRPTTSATGRGRTRGPHAAAGRRGPQGRGAQPRAVEPVPALGVGPHPARVRPARRAQRLEQRAGARRR